MPIRAYQIISLFITLTTFSSCLEFGTSVVQRRVQSELNGSSLTVGFAITQIRVSELSGIIPIEVSLNTQATAPITVSVHSTSGSSQQNVDYVFTTQELKFEPGQLTTTVDVSILDDQEVEGDESFLLSLSEPNGATISNKTVEVIILDDDSPQALHTVRFAQSRISVAENSQPQPLDVIIQPPPPNPITIQYQVVSITASAGTDYNFQNGSITFSQGQSVQTIQPRIIDDNELEVDEQFRVELISPSSEISINEPGRTILYTIIDDEPRPAGVQFATTASQVTEGDPVKYIRVMLPTPATSPTQVGN